MTKPLWQPPQLRSGEESESERHATWLELFYDLVFVVAIARLTHTLNQDVSLTGVLSFIVLFIPVWWVWIGTTFYATRFDTDDLGHRLLTALQIATITALAVNIQQGLAENSAGFALAYAAARAVLVAKYLRAIRHVEAARPLTTRYALGFGLAAAIWFLSALTLTPFRFLLWALGLIVDFATPLSAGQLHARLAPHPSHLPERFGLFTLIVLGESVTAVVEGVSEHRWEVFSVVAAGFGLSIAFSLWWIYFDNLDGSAIAAAREAGQVGIYQTWLYIHLPLLIGLSATGVGVEHVILSEPGIAFSPAERWLLSGGLALCLLALGIIHLTTVAAGTLVCRKSQASYRLGAAAAVLLLGIIGAPLSPVALLGGMSGICLAQIPLDLRETFQTRLEQPLEVSGTPAAPLYPAENLVIEPGQASFIELEEDSKP